MTTTRLPTTVSTGRARRVLAAFSLVEILISILILALGVLGLGALFPAIIRQQRNGTDAVNGVIAAGSARSLLVNTNWNRLLPTTIPPGLPGDMWLLVQQSRDALNPTSTNSLDAARRGMWHVPPLRDVGGTLRVGDRSSSSEVEIEPRSRLLPTAGEGDPQYVWDFGVQLDPADPRNGSTPPAGRLRAAVFVRRIDPGIRVDPQKTLLSMLLPPSGVGFAARVPVGENAAGNPTQDGTDGAGGLQYSKIRQAAIAFRHIPGDAVYGRRDRLYIGPDMANQLTDDRVVGAISQINQKIVDNLGNVYTVTGFGVEGTAPYVVVDPPVPASVIDPSVPPSVPPVNDPARFRSEFICSALFTLQTPAAVVTVEINP